MVSKKRKDKSEKKEADGSSSESVWKEIKQETWRAVFAILFFVLAFITILASFNKAGIGGEYIYNFIRKLFGIGYFLLPVLFVMIGTSFLKGIRHKFEVTKVVGAFLFFISALGLLNLLPYSKGGIIGNLISSPLLRLFDLYATTALLFSILIISSLITFDMYFTLDHFAFWRKWIKKDSSADLLDTQNQSKIKGIDEKEGLLIDKAISEIGADENQEIEVSEEERMALKLAEEKMRAEKGNRNDNSNSKQSTEIDDEIVGKMDNTLSASLSASLKDFTPPPLTLLEKDKGKPEVGDIKANANIIKRTLQNFGINVEMDEVSIGPSVTRYALKPAEGVKLSRIVALNNDLSLALAAHPIRIEAPIPGKSLVGIEIPNSTKTTVGLASLLSNEEYQNSEKPLLISLGKSITGKSFFANLAKAPHMLIAGATGSGKSVTIHTLITSLLYRNSPENLRFIMIDPKRVELTLYNKIPHLLKKVITDPKQAILALKWAGQEMQRRYDILEKNSVRDIDSYHTTISGPALVEARAKKEEGLSDEEIGSLPETMPYIVVIIDELADIMQTYPRELEAAIVRLAQMSRAVGIHLILSTQRPSVNVITGLIKANVPSRVALQVASQIDSRTILDGAGAENLLGAGDMLYQGPDMAKPVRLQSAYIGESELKRVVQYLYDQYKDEIISDLNIEGSNKESEPGNDTIFGSAKDDIDVDEEMYPEAKKLVLDTGQASTTFLQRKLGVGYARAAKIMDILEEKGIVSKANGSKKREVYGYKGNSNETATEITEDIDIDLDTETDDEKPNN